MAKYIITKYLKYQNSGYYQGASDTKPNDVASTHGMPTLMMVKSIIIPKGLIVEGYESQYQRIDKKFALDEYMNNVVEPVGLFFTYNGKQFKAPSGTYSSDTTVPVKDQDTSVASYIFTKDFTAKGLVLEGASNTMNIIPPKDFKRGEIITGVIYYGNTGIKHIGTMAGNYVYDITSAVELVNAENSATTAASFFTPKNLLIGGVFALAIFGIVKYFKNKK